MSKNTMTRHESNAILTKMTLVMLVTFLSCSAWISAATPSGLNFGIGIGAHIPSDDASYGDIGADLYPEFQLMFDISGIRLGGSVGYVYREVESYSYSSRYGSSYYDYEMSFMPVKFNIAILPVRFAKPDSVFQPYIGVGFGSYIATGDNNEDLTIVSFNAGFQFDFSNWYNLSVDFAYNNVSDPEVGYYDDYYDLGGADLSYGTVMIVNRFRIPFSKAR